MTRRLTLAIVGTVAATLVLAGLGTLVLARFGARQQTADELRANVREIAASVQALDTRRPAVTLQRLQRALDLEGVEVVVYGPAGNRVGPLPSGVSDADLDVARLREGAVVSGNHGSLVYAAAPVTVQGRLTAVVATRTADPLLEPAFRWFVIAALATLLVGTFVAWNLGRRLTMPIRQAEEATKRIAAGDLATRLPASGDDELASLMASINTMAEALERSQGVERQFLLSISHDLRTPLTSIRGYAEAIADRAVAEPADAAGVILAEARRLERLVRDLLDLATLESRAFSLRAEPVDVADVVAGIVDGFRPEAEDAGITLHLGTAADGAVVTGDADRLAQAGANLVENAIKFAASRVTVTVTAHDGYARLDVIDDGPGIAAEDLPHVFERLYVSRHRPQRTESGSGLGLAIVRELVAAMGGLVEASVAPGGGACLSVLLPLAPVTLWTQGDQSGR